MSKREWKMGPIKMRDSTFVKWRLLEFFFFFEPWRDHGETWEEK
jgi:hypothetical protein